MHEIFLILGAAGLFCVLVFGAAWLTAAWISATGARWRLRRPRR